MASASQSMISASSCAFLSSQRYWKRSNGFRPNLSVVRASAESEETDCNLEECAPDKEVGKVSVEWLAGEKTKVVGTYPPRRKGWTGYVEKDTAGQTNIYSVEPAVYIAESAISSGSAGTSSAGAENTVAIVAGLALFSVVAASSVLIQVSNSPAQVQTLDYSGPSLSYYVNKFQPSEIIEASATLETEVPLTTEGSRVASNQEESIDEVVALDLDLSSSS
ncbi:protein MAINTENANCE OF PSII UNDER HIGH LIGHT 1 [Aristolochia californica]|uniref:protein MAINTENANCE OF PSII UNDER HIGH LIGHT 1 n=1 Tax=Aristolochia californica TaxID=171875 RepID=UPI0035E3879E